MARLVSKSCAARSESLRRDGRVVEGARLESVYTPKAYRGFESLSLRHLFLETAFLAVSGDCKNLRFSAPDEIIS
jgi:hypothetical protein